MNTLKAEKRDLSVKAKKLRREGFVTGNVIGREIVNSIPVKMEKSAVDRLLKTSNKGSRISLVVDDVPMDVLIKDVEFNPLKGQVEEIGFQALVSGEMVHSVAEIVLVNHDKVIDGVLEQLLEEISYKALPSALVEKIKIDVGELHVGDSIKVKDLDIVNDKDVDILTDLDATIVNVTEFKNTVPADDSDADAEEAAE